MPASDSRFPFPIKLALLHGGSRWYKTTAELGPQRAILDWRSRACNQLERPHQAHLSHHPLVPLSQDRHRLQSSLGHPERLNPHCSSPLHPRLPAPRSSRITTGPTTASDTDTSDYFPPSSPTFFSLSSRRPPIPTSPYCRFTLAFLSHRCRISTYLRTTYFIRFRPPVSTQSVPLLPQTGDP